MMLTRALFFLLLALPAFAQPDPTLRYATFADLPTAQALSASAWAAVRCTPQPSCDAAQVTQFNYPIIGLSDLTFAIVIHTGDVYQGEHLSLPNAKVGTVSAGTYTSGSGAVSLTTTAAHGVPVGGTFSLTAMAGTGSVANLNATFTATAGTTGSTLNFTTTTGQTMTIASGGAVRAAKSFDLTAGQIAALSTRAQMGTRLADVLQVALVNSRVLAGESTAINTYKSGHASFATNYNALIGGPIDLQDTLTSTVFNELISAGVLTAARAAVILAPQSVSVVTQPVASQQAVPDK